MSARANSTRCISHLAAGHSLYRTVQYSVGPDFGQGGHLIATVSIAQFEKPSNGQRQDLINVKALRHVAESDAWAQSDAAGIGLDEAKQDTQKTGFPRHRSVR